MRYLIGLLFFLLFASFVITGGIWLLYRLVAGLGLPLGDRTTDNLVRRLRSGLQKARSTLVPWDKEMFSLLSLNRIDVRKPGFFGQPASGVFTTIYHEPVLAYAVQRAGKAAILVAQTTDREFVFRQKQKSTEVWVNGMALGVYTNGVFLAPGSKGRILARFTTQAEENQFPVEIAGGAAAAVANPERSSSPNPRALMVLRDLNPEEEHLVLAMVILKTVW